ncbi:MAG: Ycf48-like protein [Ignavibacteriaceae bacterium]|nr:Ycf48-like protein [Ignavibacteriaceae bacterium]
MFKKKSLKFNFLLSLLLAGFVLITSLSRAQPSDLYSYQEKQKLTYHRNDNVFLENYNPNDKAKYFPLRSTGIWTEINPNVPRVDYIGVDFINSDSGWACGLWGAVIRTTDAGQDWTTAETPTGEILLKVHSYNGQTVIVVGHNGTILRSSDGGEIFILLTGITTQELWGVRMLNDTLGWICGRNQTLLRTTDAGLNWQPVVTGFNYHYWSFDFLNENYWMIACSQGRVLKTTNAGQSFTQQQVGNTDDLYTIDIIDSLHIAAAGYFGKNVYSSDGGITWIENQRLTSSPVNWIEFINTEIGYAVVESSISMYKTTNRGQSWALTGFNRTGEWQFELLNDILGYGVGAGLKVTKTDDGYNTGYNLFLNVDWSDVFFINEMKGFLTSAALGEKVYKTEDGGNIYEIIENSPEWNYDVLFLDSLTGFLGSNTIYKTTDGGYNWYATNGAGQATKIFFINSLTGWAVGGRNIYKTTDSGENWFVQFTHISDSFTSIFFIDSLNGWATSRYIHQTTDGGANWIERMDIPAFLSKDILFKDYLNGFVLESNKFYSTVDGGVNWILNPFITGFSIAGKLSKYENSIFVTGYKTFRSIDGGINWFDFDELTGIRINGLSLLGMGSGFAVGELGIVLRYYDETVPVELMNFTALIEGNKVLLNWATASETNNSGFYIERTKEDENYWETLTFINGAGTSTSINHYYYKDNLFNFGKYKYRLKQIDFNGQYEYSNEIEVNYINNFDFYLLQNYPNPFNPITTIKYDLPASLNPSKGGTLVNLVIYDILGRRVKVLVNEIQQAGRYEVQFDASDLSRGVYIYQLISEKYMNSKKMILLK